MGALCTRCLRPSLAGMQYETLRNEMDMTDLQTVMSYNLGLSSTDITQLIDNEDNKNKLLDILPTYLSYKTKLSRCEDAKETCVDHLRDIVQTEHHKLQFIVNSLEIIMFKIAMGNLEVSDTQIEALATKYATDQTTISDLEKSLRVIDEDKRCSFTLMNNNASEMVVSEGYGDDDDENEDEEEVVVVAAPAYARRDATNNNSLVNKKSAVTANVCCSGGGSSGFSSCSSLSSAVVRTKKSATNSAGVSAEHANKHTATIIELGEDEETSSSSSTRTSSSSSGASSCTTTAPTAIPVTVLNSNPNHNTHHQQQHKKEHHHHHKHTTPTSASNNNGTCVNTKKKVSFSKVVVENSVEELDLPDVPDTEPAILQLSSSSSKSSSSPKSHHPQQQQQQRERPLLLPC
ncbi:protein U44 [Proboscivirus elephantidbeta4]|uniref:Tegument protein UL51 homolog n=1 Tax=Elephant endotheliotropic herpesvirus 4 TaxID=548914 RepID=A0A0S1TPQ2_9BETA|nr:protein U44 [Elephant endotheliotropic herpesvirus 4]ALM25976.1 protein U44 [Elephant endotheliotropic herpesvirus 4]